MSRPKKAADKSPLKPLRLSGRKFKQRLKRALAPLSTRERLVYGSLVVGFLALIVVPRVTADIGDVGSIFSVAASQCTSDEQWLAPENISGQPSLGVSPPRSELVSSNSALWTGVAGSIECSGYSSVLNHTQINNAIGITFAAVATMPEEAEIISDDETQGITAIQDGAILHERVETRPVVIEPNILGNDQATTPIDAIMMLSISDDNGQSWQLLHSFDRSITSATESRFEIAIPSSLISQSSQLAVRLETVLDEPDISLFVDSMVWSYEVGEDIDVTTKIIDPETKQTITDELPVLNEVDDIVLEIGVKDANDGLWQGLGSKATSFVMSDDGQDLSVNALLYDADGRLLNQVSPDVTYTETDLSNTEIFESVIDIMPTSSDPGKYRLDLEVAQTDGAVQTVSQDFLWGVLALNTDKDVYSPGQTALVQMSVLDEFGATVCDANLSLNVSGPGTNVSYSNNNGIEISDTCEVYGSQIEADYRAEHLFEAAGEYTLTLNATTENGSFEIIERLSVNESNSFVVTRTGPTRIFPVLDYPMTIEVYSQDGFSGRFEDYVPIEFDIFQSGFSVDYNNVAVIGDQKVISWNIDLAPGESIKLGYGFDAPDISPEFYVLGSGQFIDNSQQVVYQEQRQWQIAGDAIEVFRVTTYELQSGEFTGTTYTLDLNNNLQSDYFTMIVGPSIATGSRSPDEDMVRVSADPFSNFGTSTGAAQIELTRGDATNNWIGSVTIVECLQQCAVLGFELDEVIETSLAAGSGNSQQTVNSALGANYTANTVPFGGIRGGGFSTSGTDVNAYATTGGIKISKVNSDEIQFDRYGSENRTPAAGTVTTYIVDWGTSWNVQATNVTGTNFGAGLDATGEYNNATITSVVRDETFVWGNGFTRDDGLGDGAFGQAITLGDGVTPNTNETQVSVGGEGAVISPGRDFEVYVMEHADLSVDHRLRTRGDQGAGSGFQELDLTVDNALTTETYDNTATDVQYTEGNRLPIFTTTSGGVGQAYSRTGAWGVRLDATGNLNYWRAYAGQPVTGWAEIVDFGNITYAISDTTQEAYRWRDDSTDLNTTGGWLAAEDTAPAAQAKNSNLRLRLDIANREEGAESASRSYELQFAAKSSHSNCTLPTTWAGLTDSGTDAFTTFDSTHIDPDGEATTSGLLSNGGGYSYTNGEGRDSADNTGAIGPLAAETHTELEFTIQPTTAAVTGETYCFRVYDVSSSSTIDTYTVFPELTISSTDTTLPSGLGEAGTFTSAIDGGWTTINFTGTYTTPVVVGTTNTQNGQDALVFEARNVTSTSAQMRVCESEGSSANGCDTHAAETVGYMVIDAADTANFDGIDAGTVSISGGEPGAVTTNYTETFSTAPYVYANVNTVNSSEVPIEVVVRNTSTTSFNANICDHLLSSNDACDNSHGSETVGWVAIEPGNTPFDEQNQMGLPSISNSVWTAVTFSPAFSAAPVVIVNSQTDNGGQDVEINEARLVTTTGSDVRYCEIDALDSCDTHAADNVAWLAIESGELETDANLDQDGYRFYENTDSVTPTTALANEDAAATAVEDGDIVRLRLAIQTGTSPRPVSSTDFTLQYGQGSTCSAIVSWTDVGSAASGAIWRGYDNSTPSDGATVASSLLDGTNNTLQSYEEENDTALNPTQISAGGRGEWDFVIENNGATANTDYCFRVITTADDVIEYTTYPQLTTASGVHMLLLYDGASIPSGWTCVSCTGGDAFIDRFIRGDATYGGTGGAATHNHTGSASAAASATTATENLAGATLSDGTHAHTVSGLTFSNASNLPVYRQLQVIVSDASTANVDTIPSGGIILLDTSTIPSGYTRYSAQDGSYVRGQNTIGTTGGSNTHTHTVTANLDAATGATDGRQNGGTQVAAADAGHTHTFSASSPSANNEPPYIEVVLAQANSDTAIPDGIIGMFDNTLTASEWTCVSCMSGDALYQRFFKPATTYGTTGGSATHSHTNFSADSSGPSSTTNGDSSNPNTAGGSHVHSVSVTGISTDNHLPPYINAVFYSGDFNDDPNSPTSLDQEMTDTTSIAVDGWTNEATVVFTANGTDQDNPDTIQLCVEVQPVGTAFTNIENNCGTGVAYSGAAVAISVSIGGLSDGESYHWQARVKDVAGDYSAWVSFGANPESSNDFNIDTTAPTGIVYDGSTVGVDVDYNNGSLSELSANWNIDSSASGLSGYEYSIGTTAGGTDVLGWTNNGATASVTASSLTLNTSQPYYFNVRTTDNATNQSTISSDGIFVSPTLVFDISNTLLDLGNLNTGNSFTSTDTTTLTTSTNAYNGYIIRAVATGLLQNSASDTIGMFSGGSYAAPDEWLGGDTGYGYYTDDTLVNGSNRYNNTPCPGGGNPPCFAPFSLSAPGDIIADHTTTVSGSPIVDEEFTVTHRVTSDSLQEAGQYQTTIVYTITAKY